MKAKIYPSSFHGSITIPTSKSYAHRLIIFSCLFNSKTSIHNISFNDDIIATIDAMRLLGANIDIVDNSCIINGPIKKSEQSLIFNVNESGSTLRFLMPLISLLCDKPIIKTKGNLANRPLNIYQKYFDFKIVNNDIFINSTIKDTHFEVDGSVSSQFISGIIFYLIFLNIDATIKINNDIVSKNYLLLTIKIAKSFGIDINLNHQEIKIKKHNIINNDDKYNEIDYSQAAFFMVLNKINPKNEIIITNQLKNSLQSDFVINSLIHNCCDNAIIDLKNCPDLGPVLVCLYIAKGFTAKFINSNRLKIKESNRIAAMQYNLKYFNYELKEYDNYFIIKPLKYQCKNKEIILNAFHDHRIIMSLAILATIQHNPMIIDDIEFVQKSYPNFFNDLKTLGGKIDIYE